jgi:hypothetical protein
MFSVVKAYHTHKTKGCPLWKKIVSDQGGQRDRENIFSGVKILLAT